MPLAHEPQHEAGVDAARARRHDDPLERREPHRRVDRRAVGDRGERRAGAEVARDDPRASAERRAARRRAAPRTRARARGSRSGAGRTARATRAGSAYVAAAAGRPAWNAVSKHATAGSPGRARAVASIAASAFGWCSGASGVRLAQLRDQRGVERARPGAPPAVDDPVRDDVRRPELVERAPSAVASTSVPGASASCSPRSRRRPPSSAQLDAARAGVDAEDRTHQRRRQRPVADLRRVDRRARACSARSAQPLVDHLLAQRRGARRRGPATRSITSITRW